MWVRTLVEGGQQAEEVAGDLVALLGDARASLDLALDDLRLPGPVGGSARFQQWEANPDSRWKGPLLHRALTVFTGKDSTPYTPGSVHDFMHAKLTVADDTVFVGSFNLSRSRRDERRERARARGPRAGGPDGELDRRGPRALPRPLGFGVVDVHAHLAGAYERAAPTYDRAAFSHHAAFGEPLAQMVLLGPGGRVLDVGCGAGGALLPAARRVGPTGEAVGIDLAEGMVARTREAASEAGLDWVRAEVMDGASLDFEDAHFDAVLCAFTLAAIPDAAGALAEMRRVLRPTGTIGISLWDNVVDDEWRWEGALMQEVAEQAPPELLETVGRLSGRFAGAAKLHAALADAGFGDIKIERMHVDRSYPSAEAWWEWFWSGGTRAFLESLPESAQEHFRERGLEQLRDAGEWQRTRRFVALLARARV
jgi:ubiquinone/menaquinone biosynthesis C-methylase UbiE